MTSVITNLRMELFEALTHTAVSDIVHTNIDTDESVN